MWINILIFCGLLALVVMGALQKRSDSQTLKRRIERIKQHKTAMPKSVLEMSLRRKTTEKHDLAYWLLKPFPDSKRMANILERAGSKKTPKQFIFRCAATTFGIMVFVSVLLDKPLLVGLAAGMVFGVWVPFKLLARRIHKQSQAFLSAFPEAIELIVRGLRSGLPVSESIVQVATELPEPLASVFSNISNTMKLGVPLEKALLETAKKLELREFYFFTTSIVLQRETGGNLAEILNNLAEVLRLRFMMRMKIHSLTSEARASTMIIAALPFVVVAALMFLNPEYLRPLIDDPGGHMALATAAAMMGFGIWSMNRMAQFEI